MRAMLPALIISTLAGMSTALGGLISILSKRTDERFLSASLGFSAGVMLLVSFNELLPDAKLCLTPLMGQGYAGLGVAASLILGALTALLISRVVIPADKPQKHTQNKNKGPSNTLIRVGFVTAIAVTVHNLPEGIATFMAGYADLKVGLAVAISIALHNIPEGIAVAAPIYYGTGSRARALLYSALSGLSEPLGALLAFLVLAPFLNSATLGIIYGTVAGIMIAISFDSLIPASQRYGHTLAAIMGLFTGLFSMKLAITLFHL